METAPIPQPTCRAELHTAIAGLAGILECRDMATLRKQIAKEWLPTLDDGNHIRIFVYYGERW